MNFIVFCTDLAPISKLWFWSSSSERTIMNDSLISGLKVTESVSTLFQVKALDSYLDFDLIKVLFLFLSLLDRLYCTLSKLAKVCYYLPLC